MYLNPYFVFVLTTFGPGDGNLNSPTVATLNFELEGQRVPSLVGSPCTSEGTGPSDACCRPSLERM